MTHFHVRTLALGMLVGPVLAIGCLPQASAQALFADQPAKLQFVPFADFIQDTRNAVAGDFITRPGSKVKDEAAFEEMRQSIIDRYLGITVTHSFLAGGQSYDCVPIAQQPAVRNFHLSSIASPPPRDLTDEPVTADSNIRPARLDKEDEDAVDDFGNSASCGEGDVPLLRTTIETMTRFPTLTDYYRKSPEGSAPGQPNPQEVAGLFSHKYSYVSQHVNNLGGNSSLNVWAPYVNTAIGEGFSLSQEWYLGGSGAALQTEEVGWIVYPDLFHDERVHLFIYSTPDGYKSGCYNGVCGDFVQVAGFKGLLGSYFTKVSNPGGVQYEFSARFYLYQGNWWLNYQGTWIGYYPGAMYHGGQNTKNAQIIEFGAETSSYSFANVWAPAGSGAWASRGFGQAAYQHDLYYISTAAGNPTFWDDLVPSIPSPACYKISGPFSNIGPFSNTSAQIYFFEGGPGGPGC
jgi:hypothetical protein